MLWMVITDFVRGEHRVVLVVRAQPERREGRVPVVRVHDVRAEIHAPAAFERRARQHQEAAVFVGVGGVELSGAHTARRTRPGTPAWPIPGRFARQMSTRYSWRPMSDAQPLQASTRVAPSLSALDLRIERHEQPHVVPGDASIAAKARSRRRQDRRSWRAGPLRMRWRRSRVSRRRAF